MDFTSYATGADAGASEALTAILDRGLVAARGEDKPRDYLGGSRLGVECERALWWEYTHAPKDPGRDFSGRVLRIFERGHTAEDRMAKYLRLGGFDLATHDRDGRQFGFGVAPHPDTGRPRIAGHLDGVLRGWAAPAGFDDDKAFAWANTLPYPGLWEMKGLKDSSFNELAKKGLRVSKPVYWMQVHVYMAYKELAWCLFTAENQDNCEIYAEVVKFDAATAQMGSDRGVRVIRAAQPEELPRIARDQTDFRCRFCDYQARCWAEPAKPPAGSIPLPSGWGMWT
jgi:hypothetical protein